MLVSAILITQLPKLFIQDLNWSPDGQMLSFTGVLEGNFDIYTVRPDGTELKRLTDDPKMDIYSSWSPDGKQLLFASNRTGKRDLYTMAADGSDLKRITDTPVDEAYGMFSPDGKQIAYMAKGEEFFNIYVMSSDGSGSKQLTHTKKNDYNPYWSPDGKKIVFESDRWDTDGHQGDELLVMNADGSEEQRITNNSLGDVFPRWNSNDWITFSGAAAPGVTGLCAIKPDGTELKKILPDSFFGQFSPDGKRLAAICYVNPPDGNRRNRTYYLAVGNADGSDMKQIYPSP